MSQDQKPGKMRVVSTAAPVRRRADAPVDSPDSPATAPAAIAGTTAPAKSRTFVLPVILFLIGCAVGGVALSLPGVL